MGLKSKNLGRADALPGHQNLGRTDALPGQVRKPGRHRRSERGQASIMIGIMMLTFLFFFCFVVNVGMLVNAKINLQNAADLAAYAGAAVQARHLNRISYLNYEMRRQYKKFLFRYYVIGNMAQRQFPNGVSGPGATPQKWTPDTATPIDYKVPVVCLVFNPNDNFCQIPNLPAIKIPPKTGFDAINDALIGQLQNIEKIRQNNCLKIGSTNLLVLQLWLWNGNPTADPDTGFTQDQQDVHKIVTGLVRGLGLIPRELLLRRRIKTLNEYVNEPPAVGITFEKAEAMSKSSDPSAMERTIQAFNSAFYTLGNHTFASQDIQMDEIQAPEQLKLEDIKTSFDSYAIYYSIDKSLGPGVNNTGCQPQVLPQTVKEVTVGVYKIPSTLTYYAVRLKARAKLLFNPWGPEGLELKAYSAAMPFGSRIGPNTDRLTFTRDGTPGVNINTAAGLAFDPANKIPNLPIQRDEDPTAGKGWDTREALGTFLATAFQNPASNGSGGFKITAADLARAYQIAMAPNPWETRYYNIPFDPDGVDPNASFGKVFDGDRDLAFWAPVVSPAKAGSIDSELQSTLDDLFKDVADQPGANTFKATVKSQLNTYLGKLKSGQGEDGESMNVVRLADPFHLRPGQTGGAGADGLIALPDWMMPKDPKMILTSWNAPNDPVVDGSPGRLGYSVKFVSFDSLLNRKFKTASDGKSQADNPPGAGDEEAGVDLNFIQH